MGRIPLWLLMTGAVAMALVVLSLLSTLASGRSSLLPEPVTWVVVVLAALAVVMSLLELGRRKSRGS